MAGRKLPVADLSAEPSSARAFIVGGTAPYASPRLFVVHAPEDAWFVDGFLLPALGLPDDAVMVSRKLEPGAVIVDEIARGALCPVTVVVVSPSFLGSPWAQFAHQLVMHQGIEAATDGSASLVPAILADCKLPLLSQFRVPLDFRERDRWEAEVARLREKLSSPALVVTPVPCPYPGMRGFKTEDAAHFYGRDGEVSTLLGWLRDEQREIYVVGPSGSGKSSLVAAGLMPSLCRTPDRAGGAFLVRQLRPGANATSALASALEATIDAVRPWLADAVTRLLAGDGEHDRLLIFVDQLEEIFTIASPDTRAAFVAAIRELRGDRRVALVFALREDFYGSLMASDLCADLAGQFTKLEVGPLRGEKLRIAIEAPARALKVYFEPVLVERLLREVSDEPGALPLLQDTLLELWHHRVRGLLRLSEYDAMGDSVRSGLAVTVGRRADVALNELSPNRRETARRVLLRLVQFGGGPTMTRRRQTRAELSSSADAEEDIDAVVGHLANHRLITTSGGCVSGSVLVDLAHVVLLSGWPALGEWISAQEADEERRRALEVNRGPGQTRRLDPRELRELLAAQVAEDEGRGSRLRQSVILLCAACLVLVTASQWIASARDRSNFSGVLWETEGHPVVDAALLLVGTSCTTRTDAAGTFDFSGCESLDISTLKNPMLHATLADGRVCDGLRLLKPPARTKVTVKVDTCQAAVPEPIIATIDEVYSSDAGVASIRCEQYTGEVLTSRGTHPAFATLSFNACHVQTDSNGAFLADINCLRSGLVLIEFPEKIYNLRMRSDY